MRVHARDIKVSAADLMERTAAPMPGAQAPARPQRSFRPAPQGGAPQQAPSAAPTGAPEEGTPEAGSPAGGVEQQAAPQNEMQELIRKLQTDFFSDQKQEELSSALMTLIPMVGPEHSEKLAKVYAKFMEGMAVLKANIAALAVMVAPAAAQVNQLQQMFDAQEGPGAAGGQQQGLSVGVGPMT